MAAGPLLMGGGSHKRGRRKRNRNHGRGPGNIFGLPRGRKIVSRAKRMKLTAKGR
jgi:hypothetical protein